VNLEPPFLHHMIKEQVGLRGKSYIVVGDANNFSSPKFETYAPDMASFMQNAFTQHCPDDKLAQFLLAVEPGAYLLCNGWDPRMSRRLGNQEGMLCQTEPRGLALLKVELWRRTTQKPRSAA